MHKLIFEKITTDDEETLLQIAPKEEESHSIVLSIREELMERVMDECYKSYLKKQVIRFVAQCACDALIKHLSFNFFHHPEIPDISKSIWTPDQPIPPSPKDTWACGSTPVRPIELKEETEKEQEEVDEEIETRTCQCRGHVCGCLTPNENTALEQRFTSLEGPHPSTLQIDSKYGSETSTLKDTCALREIEAHEPYSEGSLSLVIKRESIDDTVYLSTPHSKYSESPTDKFSQYLLPEEQANDMLLAAPLRINSIFSYLPLAAPKKK